MNVLIITPKYLPTISGNTMTADRLANALRALGHCAEVRTPDQYPPQGFQPDIVHMLHAMKSYRPDMHEPHIMTMTGTDINKYGKDDPALLKRNLDGARAITVLKEEDIQRLRELGIHHETIIAIRQAVVHGDEKVNLRASFGIEGKIILLPSGFRAVKDPLYAVQECEHVDATLLILGEIYDQEIHKQADRPWVRRGKLRHEQMRSAYEQADIVLNTSDSEGQSNAILEAISLSRPILASDVPGNEIVPKPHRFIKRPGALKELAEQHLDDGECEYDIRIPTPEEEARNYISVYEKALSPQEPPR